MKEVEFFSLVPKGDHIHEETLLQETVSGDTIVCKILRKHRCP